MTALPAGRPAPTEPPPTEPARTEPAPAEPVLSCRGLRKAFGGTVVLDDLDLKVAEHEVVALIGASGSATSRSSPSSTTAGPKTLRTPWQESTAVMPGLHCVVTRPARAGSADDALAKARS